jgi:hypothetical protein
MNKTKKKQTKRQITAYKMAKLRANLKRNEPSAFNAKLPAIDKDQLKASIQRKVKRRGRPRKVQPAAPVTTKTDLTPFQKAKISAARKGQKLRKEDKERIRVPAEIEITTHADDSSPDADSKFLTEMKKYFAPIELHKHLLKLYVCVCQEKIEHLRLRLIRDAQAPRFEALKETHPEIYRDFMAARNGPHETLLTCRDEMQTILETLLESGKPELHALFPSTKHL